MKRRHDDLSGEKVIVWAGAITLLLVVGAVLDWLLRIPLCSP